jgi:hypothetical protein
MPRYSVPLLANQPQRLPYAGHVMQFVGTGVATTVSVQIESGGNRQAIEDLGPLPSKFKVTVPDGFKALSLTSVVDAIVDILVTDLDLTINSASSVVATIDSTQLPLATRPSIAQVATDNVSLGLTANVLASIVTANSLRKTLIVNNQGPAPITLGGGGQTWAKRAIVLLAGDTWIEQDCANLAFFAVNDGSGLSTVGFREVLA